MTAQRRGAVDPVRSSVLTHHNYGHSARQTHDGSKYLQVLLDIHIIIIIRRQRLKCADMGIPIHIQAHSRAYPHTCMHTCLGAMLLKERFVKIGFQGRFERANRGSTLDRNWELVPGSRSLIRERALTTEQGTEGWCSEYSSVLRRGGLPGRSMKVQTV